MPSENVTTDYVFVVIRNRHVEMFMRPWHVPTTQRQILKFIRRERDAHTATIMYGLNKRIKTQNNEKNLCVCNIMRLNISSKILYYINRTVE
jgi:hypothetical protein